MLVTPLEIAFGFSNFSAVRKGGPLNGGKDDLDTVRTPYVGSAVFASSRIGGLVPERRWGTSGMTRVIPFHWSQADPDFEPPLLHPSKAFDHPRDVVKDPDLTTCEKRAILSSWASDACAVESAPALRHPPGAKRPVTFDEVVDALQSLDDDPPPRPGGTSMRLRSGHSGPDQGHHGGSQI